jgi:quinol monooxygenase YgiN
MFGQITIYTLNEGRAEDFDRLTEWVVAQVQAKEPDTLVYIVHAVPTAPMQRILYEVYRDRTAHEEHLRRGYVMTYEAQQRPLVLATNVIELGLQQAKVSPLPSISAISDILSESGIDLTGVTRSSSQSGGQPRSRGYHRSSSGLAQDFGPGFERGRRQDLGPGFGRRDGLNDLRGSRAVGDELGQPAHGPPYSGWVELRGEDSRY